MAKPPPPPKIKPPAPVTLPKIKPIDLAQTKPRKPLPFDLVDRPDPVDEEGHDWDNMTNEEAFKTELTDVQKAFRASREREREIFRQATEANYYFVCCFESENQCRAFLGAFGIQPPFELFVDGRIIADKLGMTLPPGQAKFFTSTGRDIDKKWAALAADPGHTQGEGDSDDEA